MVCFNCGLRVKHDIVVEVIMCKYHDNIVLPMSGGCADVPAASLSTLKNHENKTVSVSNFQYLPVSVGATVMKY